MKVVLFFFGKQLLHVFNAFDAHQTHWYHFKSTVLTPMIFY